MAFDLILRGGRVVYPSQKLDAITDVGFAGGKVVMVGRELKADPGTDVRDVSGYIVTPGLIDLHTHVYWGGTSLGIDEPHLASALLHHTDPHVTEAHYMRASSVSATESLRNIVRGYIKGWHKAKTRRHCEQGSIGRVQQGVSSLAEVRELQGSRVVRLTSSASLNEKLCTQPR